MGNKRKRNSKEKKRKGEEDHLLKGPALEGFDEEVPRTGEWLVVVRRTALRSSLIYTQNYDWLSAD